jgi:ornithine carbamoyltransferase
VIPSSPEPVPGGRGESPLSVARSFRAADVVPPLLKGKRLVLLCADPDSADARLFRAAATTLGAEVSHLTAALSVSNSPSDLARIAAVLGRLYDAIECQGLPPPVVRQLRAGSGIPVFDGLACTTHSSAALAAKLGAEATAGENRRLVIQAILAFATA